MTAATALMARSLGPPRELMCSRAETLIRSLTVPRARSFIFHGEMPLHACLGIGYFLIRLPQLQDVDQRARAALQSK